MTTTDPEADTQVQAYHGERLVQTWDSVPLEISDPTGMMAFTTRPPLNLARFLSVSNDQVTLDMSAVEIDKLPLGTHYWAIQVQTGDGEFISIAAGPLKLSER